MNLIRGQTHYHTKAELIRTLWCISVLAVGIAFPASAFCQTATWTGGNSNWNNTGNWNCSLGNPCTPSSGVAVSTPTGGYITLDATATVGSLTLDNGATLYAQPVNVTGSNSLSVSGNLIVGEVSTGTLALLSNDTLSNSVTAGAGILGDQSGSNGAVWLEGNGEQWTVNSGLEVGNSGVGGLNLYGGALASVTGASCVGCNVGSSGAAVVNGSGSVWSSTGSVSIGTSGTGNVTVTNGGELSSGSTITIGTKGSVTADGGTLVGDVFNSGTLDPSSAITITGNYTQCNSLGGPDCSGTGTLTLDVGPGGYGSIDASGSITLDAGAVVDIDFVNGYTPPAGQTFDFFSGSYGFNNDGATITISGLSTPYSTTITGDDFEITTAPEPGTWVLLVTALVAVAMLAGRRKRTVLPDLAI